MICALIDWMCRSCAGLGWWIGWIGVPGWSNGAAGRCRIDVLSGSTFPENAAAATRFSWSNFEMLTDEIDHSTMNSAISSVIMSA